MHNMQWIIIKSKNVMVLFYFLLFSSSSSSNLSMIFRVYRCVWTSATTTQRCVSSTPPSCTAGKKLSLSKNPLISKKKGKKLQLTHPTVIVVDWFFRVSLAYVKWCLQALFNSKFPVMSCRCIHCSNGVRDITD